MLYLSIVYCNDITRERTYPRLLLMFLNHKCFHIISHTIHTNTCERKFLHLTTFFVIFVCYLLLIEHTICVHFMGDIKMQFKFLLFFRVFFADIFCVCLICAMQFHVSFCKVCSMMKRDV